MQWPTLHLLDQRQQLKHQNKLNRIYKLFWCTYCWLWTNKWRLELVFNIALSNYFHTKTKQNAKDFYQQLLLNLWSLSLREKYPSTEYFLLCISPYSVRIWENTDQKKLRIWTLVTQYVYSKITDRKTI